MSGPVDPGAVPDLGALRKANGSQQGTPAIQPVPLPLTWNMQPVLDPEGNPWVVVSISSPQGITHLWFPANSNVVRTFTDQMQAVARTAALMRP